MVLYQFHFECKCVQKIKMTIVKMMINAIRLAISKVMLLIIYIKILTRNENFIETVQI